MISLDVATVSRELNALTEVQPVVIGTVSNDPLCIIPVLPECRKGLLARLLHVF